MSRTPATPTAGNLPLNGRGSERLTPATPKAPLHENRLLPCSFNSPAELPKMNLFQQFQEASPTETSSDHETPDLSRQMISTPLSAALATPNIPVDSSRDGEDSMTGSANTEAALAQGMRPCSRLTNDPGTQQLRKTLFKWESSDS